MRLFLHVLFFACLQLSLSAQTLEQYYKWGKVPDEDLKMSVYPFDSSATAVILQEHAYTKATYGTDKYVVTHEVHRRIKIFDESALDEGNLSIVYPSDRKVEKFKNLDVQVFYPDGKKADVKSDNIFTEKLSKSFSAKKIFIPNLQKGCVIEYRYKLESEDIFSLYDWYFQHEMPTRWSEVELSLPKDMHYVYLLNTGQPFVVKEEKETVELAGAGSRYDAVYARYGLQHLPGISEEPFMTTVEDYRAHIGFQLSSYQDRNDVEISFISDWRTLAERVEAFSSLGDLYLKSNKHNELLDAFKASNPGVNKAQMPEKVLRFVSGNIKWNEEFRYSSDITLDEVWKAHVGTSTQINLSVVALLRELGFDAHPVMMSTRSNGQMYPQYPFLEQFNSVIAAVQIDSNLVLLDATSPFHGLNDLQIEHLNGSGWLLNGDQSAWIKVNPVEDSEIWFGTLQLNEEGVMRGRFLLSLSGPTAVHWREELSSLKRDATIKQYFTRNYPDISIDSIIINGEYDLGKPLKVEFNCVVPGTATNVNDFLYCKPVLYYGFIKAPFKSVKRNFPVDFPWPMKTQYVLNLEMPPGYLVEEVPESSKISLLQNGGKITYSCTPNATKSSIQLTLKSNISQLHFPTEDYGALKKLFELMVEKTEGQIVLKKQG